MINAIPNIDKKPLSITFALFSNSSKHSFVQNCFDFVSHNLNKDKPSICCRSFKYNNFKEKEEIEVWDIEDMLKAHDSFCKCTEEIKQRSDFKI